MTIDKAILLLGKEYARAKTLEYVRNPVAYALCHVWEQSDRDKSTERS